MKKILPIIVFSAILAVYLFTICPTIYVGDSGEVTAAAYSMGIAHSPGYPLFCFLGKLFTFIPVSNIAFRVNLLAAFLGVLSVIMFMQLLRYLSRVAVISGKYAELFIAGTALILGFSKTFWAQSLIAKGGIYTLNSLLVIICLTAFLKVVFEKDEKALLVFALFAALSLTNHHSILAPLGILGLLLLIWQSGLTFKNLWKVVLLFALGLSFYLYLPIRASAHPAMNWGDPYNWDRMLAVIKRTQYGVLSKGDKTLELFAAQIFSYIKTFSAQFTVFLAPLVLLGVYKLYKAQKRVLVLTMLLFLSYSVLMLLVMNPKMIVSDLDTVEVYYIPGYIIGAIWLYYGIAFIHDKLKSGFVMPVLAAAFFILPLKLNYFENDRSRDYIDYNYAVNMLKTPEKDSILFASQDNEVFGLAYLKKVEGIRPDITVYEDLGCVFENIYGEDFLSIGMVEHNSRRVRIQQEIITTTKRPVYFLRTASMYKLYSDISAITGFMFRFGKNPDAKKDYFALYDFVGIEDKTIYKEQMERDIIAQYYFSMGENSLRNKNDPAAFGFFKKAEETAPDISWVSNNIGEIYKKRGLLDKAMESYQNAIKANPYSSVAHENLSSIYRMNRRYAEAIPELIKAIKINPYNPVSMYNLGVCYNELENYSDAITAFLKAIEMKPDYVEAYNNLAVAYFYTGNKISAVRAWETAVRIDPKFTDAVVNLKHVRGR